MFMFFRFRLRVLEISQTEQAKVLQSLVMNMRNTHLQSMISDEEITKHVKMQMQMQQNGGEGINGGVGSTNQHNRSNDLIDVSDEEDDDDDDDDTSSESDSESSSDSGDDSDSSSYDENEETHDNTTKKIIFNNGGHLDSQMVEHLTGDDVKVIELTEPLYPVGSSSKHNTDTNDISDDDGDDDGQATSDDDDNASDGNDNDETSDDTEVKIEELPSHASLSLQQQQQQHLEVSTIDATEIKTIFKADKQHQQQQHTDYNSMNVQALKQHLKTKLSAEGMQYNETAINKLNKKELIKHLTQ
jgi:hypothetical protein